MEISPFINSTFNGMECEVYGYTDDKTPKFIVLLNGKEYELRAKDLDAINIEETPKKNIKVSVAKAKDGKEYARIWAPYSEDFIFGIKHIEGAKWLDRIKAWSIPAKSLEYAREIMQICYGKDDRQVE